MACRAENDGNATDNLANTNTPEYKADQNSLRAFPEMLISHLQKGQAPSRTDMRPVGSINTGVYMQEATPNFEQGVIKATGLTTDLALENGIMPVSDEGILGSIFLQLKTRMRQAGIFTPATEISRWMRTAF